MKKKGSRAVAAEVEEVAVACSRRVKLLFRIEYQNSYSHSLMKEEFRIRLRK